MTKPASTADAVPVSNITSLRGEPITNEARAAFLQHCAESFDVYVEKRGAEPTAVLLVWGGPGQDTHTAWLVRDEVEGSVMALRAMAMVSLLKSIINPGSDEADD